MMKTVRNQYKTITELHAPHHPRTAPAEQILFPRFRQKQRAPGGNEMDQVRISFK